MPHALYKLTTYLLIYILNPTNIIPTLGLLLLKFQWLLCYLWRYNYWR